MFTIPKSELATLARTHGIISRDLVANTKRARCCCWHPKGRAISFGKSVVACTFSFKSPPSASEARVSTVHSYERARALAHVWKSMERLLRVFVVCVRARAISGTSQLHRHENTFGINLYVFNVLTRAYVYFGLVGRHCILICRHKCA